MNDLSKTTGDSFALTFGYADEAAYGSTLDQLVADKVASGIAAQDPTLWGAESEHEASIRLSWTSLPESSRPLVAKVAELRTQHLAAGRDHVVLCGMGGSSLAPEVICHTAGVEITVLDSSQPDYVRAALNDRLERSIVVVSSKSGSTVETDSQRRAYEKAFTDAGLNPADHFVIVTDPGSPLDKESRAAGYRVINADPDVGGRYSALTAFGLVPSGLAGADIGQLLDEAARIEPALTADDTDNPGLRLGALLGTANLAGADKVVLTDVDSGIKGLGDWIEQLIAESTGKQGKGILPVVVPSTNATNFDPSTPDEVLVTFGPGFVFDRVTPASGWGAAVDVPLGAAMLLWEYAVVVAGRIIGINPFDQPDVESAKQAARDLLGGGGDKPTPDFSVDGIDVFSPEGTSLAEAVDWLLGAIDEQHGYLAVQAYLDRDTFADFAGIREVLAERLGRPVTFGWGPRFLHSTGQFHKGGTPTGVFLQITGDPVEDLAVPGREFTFGGFIDSQAAGDAAVLRDHQRPVLRLHLKDVPAGLAKVREVLA
ncbi:MAG: glucose-6-phosphate isomerase [Nocardioidaceae bacterium]|nr:glucose-6-phosphate isomerase [Nocardioidaceae bacterium]